MRATLACLGALVLLGACQTVPPVDRQEIVDSARAGASEQELRALVDDRDLGFALSYESLKGLEAAGAPPGFLDWLVRREIEREAWNRAYLYGPGPFYGPYPWIHGPRFFRWGCPPYPGWWW